MIFKAKNVATGNMGEGGGSRNPQLGEMSFMEAPFLFCPQSNLCVLTDFFHCIVKKAQVKDSAYFLRGPCLNLIL